MRRKKTSLLPPSGLLETFLVGLKPIPLPSPLEEKLDSIMGTGTETKRVASTPDGAPSGSPWTPHQTVMSKSGTRESGSDTVSQEMLGLAMLPFNEFEARFLQSRPLSEREPYPIDLRDPSLPSSQRDRWRMLVGLAKTQKAKGVLNLVDRGHALGDSLHIPEWGKFWVWPYCKPASASSYPLFARPCPITPRHGFVESQLVANEDEARALYRKALAQDPDAEMILMPRYTAKYSGIANNNQVSYGFGNDGVTGEGKGVKTIVTPAAEAYDWNMQATGFSATEKTGIEDLAFVEVVENNDRLVAVQVRNGPEVPASHNFIPEKMTVTRIIRTSDDDAGNDLIGWEKYISKIIREEGVKGVVFVNSGSLASHFAVHCILNGIAVIGEEKIGEPGVKVGDVLEPEGPVTHRFNDYQLRRMAHHIADYREYDIRVLRPPHDVDGWNSGIIYYDARRGVVMTAAATIHSAALWDGQEHLLKLRAFSVAVLARFMAIAVIGEARHFYNNGPGRKGKMATLPWNEINRHVAPGVDMPSRDRVYDELFSVPYVALRFYLSRAYKDLKQPGWRSRIGGVPWKQSARRTIELFDKMDRYLADPTSEGWRKVFEAANIVLRTAHNNGYLLDKFISNEWLGIIARVPSLGFINAEAARVVLDIYPYGSYGKEYYGGKAITAEEEDVEQTSDEHDENDLDEDTDDDEEIRW